jgi:hypothetical protein
MVGKQENIIGIPYQDFQMFSHMTKSVSMVDYMV